MSASLINQKKQMRRKSLIFLCVALFCGLFSAVYENFSHGVYSDYMVYLFMIPLLGGAVPYAALGLLPKMKCPSSIQSRIYNSGLAALAVGSCIKGVLDIYGTTTIYQPIYWVIGILLTAVGFALYILSANSPSEQEAEV